MKINSFVGNSIANTLNIDPPKITKDEMDGNYLDLAKNILKNEKNDLKLLKKENDCEFEKLVSVFNDEKINVN